MRQACKNRPPDTKVYTTLRSLLRPLRPLDLLAQAYPVSIPRAATREVSTDRRARSTILIRRRWRLALANASPFFPPRPRPRSTPHGSSGDHQSEGRPKVTPCLLSLQARTHIGAPQSPTNVVPSPSGLLTLPQNAAVEWVGRSKMDEASGRKLYRAFMLDGCKYETGDCVYLKASKGDKDEGTLVLLILAVPLARALKTLATLRIRRATWKSVLYCPNHRVVGGKGRRVYALRSLVLSTT
jgi:hypothetical protein